MRSYQLRNEQRKRAARIKQRGHDTSIMFPLIMCSLRKNAKPSSRNFRICSYGKPGLFFFFPREHDDLAGSRFSARIFCGVIPQLGDRMDRERPTAGEIAGSSLRVGELIKSGSSRKSFLRVTRDVIQWKRLSFSDVCGFFWLI